MYHLTVQEPYSPSRDPKAPSWMSVGGIQNSGCSHYHLTFCCLVFCLLLFNDLNSFFARLRSHLASDALLALLNNIDIVAGVSFPSSAPAFPLAICSCHVPHCRVPQLTLCSGLLAQQFWGGWHRLCTALLEL